MPVYKPWHLLMFQFNKPALNGSLTASSSSTSLSVVPGSSSENGQKAGEATEVVPSDIFDFYDKMDNEDDEGEDLKTVSFEVKQDHIEDIQKR